MSLLLMTDDVGLILGFGKVLDIKVIFMVRCDSQGWPD